MNNNKWIISDTHFNHEFMISSWIRPADYQQQIINNWKKVVEPEDTVYHLWDVIFSRVAELTEILNNLPWYKILIRGNHDKNTDEWYLSHWFDEVHNDYTITSWSKEKILLTHAPIFVWKDYSANICWHLHNFKWNNTFRHKECLMLNNKSRIYSAELENYRPINIINIQGLLHHSHSYIMNMWFNNIKFKYIKHNMFNFIKKKMNLIINIKKNV